MLFSQNHIGLSTGASELSTLVEVDKSATTHLPTRPTKLVYLFGTFLAVTDLSHCVNFAAWYRERSRGGEGGLVIVA
jgi:hypothetical protein